MASNGLVERIPKNNISLGLTPRKRHGGSYNQQCISYGASANTERFQEQKSGRLFPC